MPEAVENPRPKKRIGFGTGIRVELDKKIEAKGPSMNRYFNHEGVSGRKNQPPHADNPRTKNVKKLRPVKGSGPKKRK